MWILRQELECALREIKNAGNDMLAANQARIEVMQKRCKPPSAKLSAGPSFEYMHLSPADANRVRDLLQ